MGFPRWTKRRAQTSGHVRPPETRYARSGDLGIAFQVSGQGPPDIVFTPGFVSNLDVSWEDPSIAHFFEGLAAFSRLIRFDKLGTGLSDPAAGMPSLDERMDDIRAVMDAAGCDRAAQFGVGEGGPLCILFAVRHPERTSALILYGAYARLLQAADQAWGWTKARSTDLLAAMERSWATGEWWDFANPSIAGQPRSRAWWARYMRASASPGIARRLMTSNVEMDVRDILPRIRVPTLVLHRSGDQWVSVEHGRYLAAQIPGAKYIELPGSDHRPSLGDAGRILGAVEEFLTGRRHRRSRSDLSEREREVVELVIAGETARAIAARLYLSERTVESHRASAYGKLGVRSRIELVRRAAEFGL